MGVPVCPGVAVRLGASVPVAVDEEEGLGEAVEIVGVGLAKEREGTGVTCTLLAHPASKKGTQIAVILRGE